MDAAEWQVYIERSRAAVPTELCFDYVVTNRALPVKATPFHLTPGIEY